MSARSVVVDANVIFRSLAGGQADFANLCRRLDVVPHVPRFVFIELFEHSNRIVTASHRSEDEVLAALYQIVTKLVFCEESLVPIGTWVEANRLCTGVDEDDMPYVALALHLDMDLWTEDLALKAGLRARGFDRFFEP